MALVDLFANVEKLIRTGIARRMVGTHRFLYQAGFADENFAPVVDPLCLGPLQRVTSPGVYGHPVEMLPISPGRPHGAARFTVSRPPTVPTGRVALGAVVPKFPPKLSIFRVIATYARPEGIHAEGNSWAAVLQTRRGGPEIDDRPHKILTTLQAAWNPDPRPGRAGAKMNTPLPIQGQGAGVWIPQPVFEQLYPLAPPPAMAALTDDDTPPPPPPPPDPDPVFALQQDVDRSAGSGRATLFVKAIGTGYVLHPGPGFVVSYHESREFTHPFMPFTDGTTPNVIGAAGFLIAVAGGQGPASVTVQDFRIYGLTGRDLMLDIMGVNWMPERVVGMLRGARKRLIEWSFASTAVLSDPWW